jgi:hypothetical protein
VSAHIRVEQMQQAIQKRVDAHGAEVSRLTELMQAAKDGRPESPTGGSSPEQRAEAVRDLEAAMNAHASTLAELGEQWPQLVKDTKRISAMMDLGTAIRRQAGSDETLMRTLVQGMADAGNEAGESLYEELSELDVWWAEKA